MGDKKKEHTKGIELEELSEFPEKVSISEDSEPLEIEDLLEDMPDATFEEITDLEEKTSNNIEIADGFIEGSDSEDALDILDLTSEIDQLNNIDDHQKEGSESHPIKDKITKQGDKKSIEKNDQDVSRYKNNESEGMYFDDAKDEFIIEDLPETSLEEDEHYDEKVSPTDETFQKDVEKEEAEEELEEDKKDKKEDKSKLTIDIPEEFRDKLYENMEMENFGSIDLNEAEEIANEDILFLNEDDLVEELEDFELTPVEKNQSPRVDTAESKIMASTEKVDADIQKEHEERTQAETDVTQEIPVEEFTRDEKSTGGQEDTTELPDIPEIDEPAMEIEEMAETDTVKPTPIETEMSEIRPAEEDVKEDISHVEETVYHVPEGEPAVKEQIPQGLAMATSSADQIRIVDDEMVDREYDETVSVFEEDSLDRISSGIIEVIEGEAKVLKEADPVRDEEKVAHIMRGTLPTFEDLLIDFEEEFKFKDDDVIFIDNAFMADDYDKYLHEIDEYYEQKKKKGITTAVELLGLTRDEMNLFEGAIFEKEYESVNIADQFGVEHLGMDQAGEDFEIVKDINYFIDDPHSLTEREKKSIEDDVESEGAVIFEENVNDIVSRLKTMDPDYSKDDEIIPEKTEAEQTIVSEAGKDSNKSEETVPVEDETYNISDKVVILDNKEDLNRFVDTMPVEKQENIRKLMAYLDSLFEQLPEDVIKKFANSEYFDLYVKVLNDLGM